LDVGLVEWNGASEGDIETMVVHCEEAVANNVGVISLGEMVME
jgi:hypothetical protein